MLMEQLKWFIDNFTFQHLINWFYTFDPIALILNPFVLVPIIVVIGLFSYSKTNFIAQKIIAYGPTIGYLFVTGVILKNDNISSIGPFIMMMAAFFMIVGWFIWNKLLGD